jgi:hypothetical protein
MTLFVPLEKLDARSIRVGVDNTVLIENIKTNGFSAKRPILLMPKGYYVRNGVRRVEALRALTPEEQARALSEFNGLVPCIRR